jgi:5'-methylthioadenosine phosphorylase
MMSASRTTKTTGSSARETVKLALIGGSGLYSMPGLADRREYSLVTPFGNPSAPIVTGNLEGRRVAFLARHGEGHRLSPTEVPYRANIFALKMLGVERILSISACGSLREDYAPGHIVIPDQLFDSTKSRARSFFEDGLVAHISVADPFCPDLSAQLEAALGRTEATTHRGGTLITVEGPRFSTKAESQAYRSWGLSLIGMTASPEAFLAREAEICYAVMAHVTDYDVWHASEAPVTVEQVVRTLNHNTELAQLAIRHLVRNFSEQRPCSCKDALAEAIITAPGAIRPATRKKLGLLVDKYLS